MSSTDFDTIVIGAGVSGLSCAAHLAKAGKRVIVFEQSKKPGGYCCSYTRKKLIFDPGAHWILDGPGFNSLLDSLNTEPIEFIQLPSVYRILGPTRYVDVNFADRELFVKSMRKSFPHVKDAALTRLIDIANTVKQEMDEMPTDSLELLSLWGKVNSGFTLLLKARNMMKYSKLNLQDFLKDLFPGDEYKDLRAALHIAPGEETTAIALLVFLAFGMAKSAWGPKGGAQKISDALASAVKKNGGKIVYSKKVVKIDVDDKRINGVTLDDKTKYTAKTVVAAIDAKQLYNKLLKIDNFPKKFKQKIDETPFASSWFSVSIVTDLNPADYDFDGTDVLFINTNDIVEAGIPNNPEKNAFVAKFNSLHDESFKLEGAKEEHHSIHLVSPATFDYKNYWKAGKKLNRGDKYIKFKKDYAKKLVKRMEERIPNLGKHIVNMDISTPLTYHRYTLNHHGSGLGWSDMILWKQRIKFVKGLFHAGMWSFPGPMVEPSIESGKNAAILVLKQLKD
ncbi:MAG: Phytoene desaturase (neurosporene-forming) [Candidatus Heimdallarchaeota archaeon AB_125]|nr:MAG: Phytoene desaturase (neurosporene-forming) [Candidatus Heimdallarchaeota archaeon AB_125]